MESLLFTLDVFLMFVLVWAVYKSDRDAGSDGNLGFFAFRDAAKEEPKTTEIPPHA